MIEIIKKCWRKIILIIVAMIIGLGIYNWTFNINNIPEGNFIDSLNSPNNKYILKAYEYSPGATVNWTLRVEVIDTSTNKRKNIYYNKNENTAEMIWIDEENVIINGKKLNIYKDKFDFRVD